MLMTHPTDDGPALKPCPFCGGKAELASGGPGNHFVRCADCHAGGDDGAQERAIEWWNRRAQGPALKPSDEAREDDSTKCEHCGGNGWKAIRNPHRILPGVFEVRCDNCNGFGWVQQEDPVRP